MKIATMAVLSTIAVFLLSFVLANTDIDEKYDEATNPAGCYERMAIKVDEKGYEGAQIVAVNKDGTKCAVGRLGFADATGKNLMEDGEFIRKFD